VINSNWQPISYRFGVIAAYCSNFAPTRSLWLKISGRRGRPPPIIFASIVRPMNALQLCPWQFSHSCYGWGATSENRSKIGDFAPTRSLRSKISGTRGQKSGQISLSFCQRSRVWRTDRRTDGQTDRILLAIPRLHYMQRGKNADDNRFEANVCKKATPGAISLWLGNTSARSSNNYVKKDSLYHYYYYYYYYQRKWLRWHKIKRLQGHLTVSDSVTSSLCQKRLTHVLQ